ncbi:hypothetical protein HYDPIDRAFT_59655, partial [Hydnomerulius pinastri MD-312]
LVTGSRDGGVRVWNRETGAQIGNALKGHTRPVNAVGVSPDGRIIVSGSSDSTVRIWGAETEELLHTLDHEDDHEGWVRAVHISPDSKRVASGSRDKSLRVWDIETGEEQIRTWKAHDNFVDCLSLSRNGTHLATGSYEEKTAFVFDITTGEQIAAYEHDDNVREIAHSPSGRFIATACVDKKAYLWDAPEDPQATTENRPAPIQTYEWHGNRVFCVAFFPDEQQLVTGSLGGGVRVWNRETGAQIGNVLQGHSDVVWAVDVSPDRRTIVSGSDDNMVRIWDAKTEELLHTLRHEDDVNSVHISPDSKRVASGSSDQSLRVWDIETGDRPAPIQTYEGHESVVSCVAFFQDEQRLVTGSVDGGVRVWNRETGAQIGDPLEGHTEIVYAVDVSPDGRTIVSGSGDRTVKIWDAETEELLRTLNHEDSVYSVHISPDSKRVASGSDDEMRVWDIETGK